jgi:CDP-diacylglycerol--serine O-phosphatidyltransferase
MKRRVYFIPNAITAFALACGLFVIFKINMVEPGEGSYHVLFTSLLVLLVAAVADVLDGAVARIIKGESEFGIIFDSLADAVSFGVAPSVLLLKSLSLEQGTGLSFFAIFGAMVYSICGVLRLVRFNVKAPSQKGMRRKRRLRRRILQVFRSRQLPLRPFPATCFLSRHLRKNGFIYQAPQLRLF